jgi:hypothetical protein
LGFIVALPTQVIKKEQGTQVGSRNSQPYQGDPMLQGHLHKPVALLQEHHLILAGMVLWVNKPASMYSE